MFLYSFGNQSNARAVLLTAAIYTFFVLKRLGICHNSPGNFFTAEIMNSSVRYFSGTTFISAGCRRSNFLTNDSSISDTGIFSIIFLSVMGCVSGLSNARFRKSTVFILLGTELSASPSCEFSIAFKHISSVRSDLGMYLKAIPPP